MSLPRRALQRLPSARPFSSTPTPSKRATRPAPTKRITRDRNPLRGVSPLRRQAQRQPLHLEKHGLPVPVLDPAKHSKVDVDPDHGLWGFFHDRQALTTPEDDHAHGRAWAVEELRAKSWEDLHKLWWACVKERNVNSTQVAERKRLKPGYGDFEGAERCRAVKATQRAIKHVLTERYYAWQEARELAVSDPEINLSGSGPLYTPIVVEDAAEKDSEEVVEKR